jgi:K+-transporting ATPase KdpF subunit
VTVSETVGLIVAVALFAYFLLAMLLPERF